MQHFNFFLICLRASLNLQRLILVAIGLVTYTTPLPDSLKSLMKSSTEILADQLNSLKVEKTETPHQVRSNTILLVIVFININYRYQLMHPMRNSTEKYAPGVETVCSERFSI